MLGHRRVPDLHNHALRPKRAAVAAICHRDRGARDRGLAGDVWRYGIADDTWTLVSTDGGIAPGIILASTYDGDADRVVILDDIGLGDDREARLWSLDLATGATHLHGSWPRRSEERR